MKNVIVTSCLLVWFSATLGCGSVGTASVDALGTCTADAFLDCAGTTARFCNATGDDVVAMECGAPGCNADQMRCNECVPDTSACNAGATLETCDADGIMTATDCFIGCVDAPAPHCAYLEPRYLPDVCDTLATDASLVISTNQNLDTGTDVVCNGGIVPQMGGPAICVVRYGTIQFDAVTAVTGNRALALVADDALDITGTLDASANDRINGPGGGTTSSGGTSGVTSGGGGAGFRQAGGDGATTNANGGANNGGPVLVATTLVPLVGGPRSANPILGSISGGGGGAVTLISCRGTVTVSGTIDAGGGGGSGGYDLILGAGSNFTAGAGGGAGGYVVLQGLGVNVTNTARLFANGGGGGAGTSGDDVAGQAGRDGTPSTTISAAGGVGSGSGGAGGAGGRTTVNPTDGMARTSPGGGGGSVGRFQVYTSVQVMPTLTPAAVSPPFDGNLTTPTR